VPAVSSPAREADRLLNRELSWLDFNARVLELAEDDGVPLLERVKFCAIYRRTSTSSSWFASPASWDRSLRE
jgi:polyphosphate kinase